MYLATVKFGRARSGKDRDELKEIAETYLVALLRNGQLCGDYLVGWEKGLLHSYVYLPRPNAFKENFHSQWARECLKKSFKAFGSKPQWILLEDNIPRRFQSWKDATSLCLCTSWADHHPPIRRMDTGTPIPAYLLPLPDRQVDDIYCWAYGYRNHDLIWTASGKLEMPAYKQLAQPNSELSSEGRQICLNVERATGVPTFYYLFRYWARKNERESRLCPGCGRKWRVGGIRQSLNRFWDFPFQCKKCRLVSHDACADEDARHARIGEYRPKKRSAR
ncbi:MAG: DUF2310 family Zn-ribbon-containing protein [Planctomycetota bacterium]|jgi:predicted  nucleic acid-binding Zn ribbon protein